MIEATDEQNNETYGNLNEEEISGFYNENMDLHNSKKQIIIDENKILMENEYSDEEEPDNQEMP